MNSTLNKNFQRKPFIGLDIKSDQEIWMDFLNGDESAIAAVYSKFMPVLYNYGMHIINNPCLVSDCIQDLFFELIDKRSKLNRATSVKFYLIASFRRRLMRQIARDKKCIADQNLEEVGFYYKIGSYEIQIMQSHEKQILEKACNSLPKRQREAIMLYFYEGLSYTQIAEIFNFSNPKNARTLIYRAIDTLSDKLAPLKNELLLLIFFIYYL